VVAIKALIEGLGAIAGTDLTISARVVRLPLEIAMRGAPARANWRARALRSSACGR